MKDAADGGGWSMKILKSAHSVLLRPKAWNWPIVCLGWLACMIWFLAGSTGGTRAWLVHYSSVSCNAVFRVRWKYFASLYGDDLRMNACSHYSRSSKDRDLAR
ncbi:hypothetical protein H112_02612 [Trichophyton rubrum D6]|uniref:Uncharacterized protein n=3 Tax=Trichophyton TaxID=5550 RepID=A0A080WPN0_TRIRC|nr:uncharacterized protein TERG_12400 [Trichophyton rubrum CBS 118892]EZF24980.1 hypothetical protein H100_02619 [Trichophyton rubrum MR850]EZF43978.1 hypothetical protein H102_02609 [Trichophyton rubrum CBS 100081]EZF54641.1 hypothetical protein H103_02623 [Trichophyton rubrum CBS 288.86]EZF65218.1 hypothetical protein H104_02601 [Trichophyton rubrum CBS 289.86]EZF75917.1 hypothetical protein H105_02627 [Trichophyton soudanense CBS 452.61]EZF86539.1 hypothetical protein H110_02618 [Trichophy